MTRTDGCASSCARTLACASGDRATVRELTGLALKGVAAPVTGYVVESLKPPAEEP